jgi:hypothetical protein
MQSSLLVRHLAAVLEKMEARALALGLSLTPLPSLSLFACPLAMAEASSSSQLPSLHPPLPILAAPAAPHLAPLHCASSFSLLCHWVPHRRGSRSPCHLSLALGASHPWTAASHGQPSCKCGPPSLSSTLSYRELACLLLCSD